METFASDDEMDTEEDLTHPECKYQHFDDNPDFQLHAWGDNMKEVFEQSGLGLFSYMSDISLVEISLCVKIQASGHDLESLLFHFLDELLSKFSCYPFLIFRQLVITKFITQGEEMKIKCACFGENVDLEKHTHGKDITSIRHSGIRIINEPADNKFEAYVAVDF